MMEIDNDNKMKNYSDEGIFVEMKKFMEERNNKIIVEGHYEDNVNSFVENKGEEFSRNDIQIEHLIEYKCPSEVSERTASAGTEFELLDPNNLNESDRESSIEELDNIIYINYENENVTHRDFWDCPYCPYKAKEQDFIHKHIVDTHASVTCYKCQECQYAHSQLSLVMSHVNRRHQKIKYQCPECKIKFTTVWNCQGHILTRHPKKAEKLLEVVMKKKELDGINRRCPFCEFIDNAPGILKKHVEKSHEEVIRFKCLYCTYKSIDTDDIADHMKDIHPEESEDIDI